MVSYTINQLSFTYPEQSRPALNQVDLTIAAGSFTLLCGPSGGGKTTLLRHLKPVLTPHGKRSGETSFDGQAVTSLSQRDQARRIGYVSQSPDNQLVTDRVWHELAFGLESLGFDNQTIRLKVAEMASFFGLESLFDADTSQLSGGQKQLVNLASVLAMDPDVLILDEPTSQLDPIAAADFLAALKKINRDLGVSIILSEHRLEDAFPLADQVVILRDGRVVYDGSPSAVCAAIVRDGAPAAGLVASLPSAARIYAGAMTGPWGSENGGAAPVDQVGATERQGVRRFETATRLTGVTGQADVTAWRRATEPGTVTTANGSTEPASATSSMADAGRLAAAMADCPLTVRDGRAWLTALVERSGHRAAGATTSSPGDAATGSAESARRSTIRWLPGVAATRTTEPAQGSTRFRPTPVGQARVTPPTKLVAQPAIVLDEVWFKYDRSSPEVLRDFSLTIPSGGLFALMGGNGVGKSTALGVIGGLLQAHRGRITVAGKSLRDYNATQLYDRLLAVLPQNPQTVFTRKTVRLDLADAVKLVAKGRAQRQEQVEQAAARVGLTDLLDRHPYDLSGGEQQRAALAKVLLLQPRIVLLDEPTKGLDADFKHTLARILRQLIADGVTVVMVSHDIEFCASYADQCALLFNGGIVSQGPPSQFFSGHAFYTTAANRIARDHWPEAITVEEVTAQCLAIR